MLLKNQHLIKKNAVQYSYFQIVLQQERYRLLSWIDEVLDILISGFKTPH